MGDVLPRVLLFALVPVVATLAGGVIATYRTPGPRLRSAIQHFAAGVVFAAVAVELLPDVVHRRAPLAAVAGFALGVGVLLALRRAAARLDAGAGRAGVAPTGLIVATALDVTVDGLLIGIGFAAGAKEGILITVALTLELLFLGLAVAAALGGTGVGRGRVLGTIAGLAALLVVGATVGTLALGGLTGAALEVVLAFGCAALLYLVTEELLVEAHEVPETDAITVAFFAGFVLLLVIDMLA
jgi:ZIP family zinc transporter